MKFDDLGVVTKGIGLTSTLFNAYAGEKNYTHLRQYIHTRSELFAIHPCLHLDIHLIHSGGAAKYLVPPADAWANFIVLCFSVARTVEFGLKHVDMSSQEHRIQ